VRHRVTADRLQRMYRTVIASLPDRCTIYPGYVPDVGFSGGSLYANVPCHLVSQGTQSELETGVLTPKWINKSTWRIHLPKYIRLEVADAIDCQGMVLFVDSVCEVHTYQMTNTYQLTFAGTAGSTTTIGEPDTLICDHLLREIVANEDYLLLAL